MKPRNCIWNCGRKTERRCGICIFCCDQRDAKNKAIDAGEAVYIPPTERPGHRFYERKQLSQSQLDHLAAMRLKIKSKSL